MTEYRTQSAFLSSPSAVSDPNPFSCHDAAPADFEVDDSSLKLALTAAKAADERKAQDIVLLRVGDVSYVADYLAIATGLSRVQVRAIADSVRNRIEDDLGLVPLRTEGRSDASWILLDYGDAIVHVLLPEEREFYDLEAFWGHGERIDLPFATFQDDRRESVSRGLQ